MTRRRLLVVAVAVALAITAVGLVAGTTTADGDGTVPDDYENVSFADADRASEFTEAAAAYEEKSNEAADLAATDLNDPTEETLEAYRDATAEREAAYEDVENVLFQAAMDGNDDAAAALREYRTHRDNLENELESDVETAVARADERATRARLTIAASFIVPLLGGVVLGWAGGRRIGHRDLSAVTRRRRRNADYDYSLTQLWKPFLVAFVLFAVGLGVLFVSETILDLLQVIR